MAGGLVLTGRNETCESRGLKPISSPEDCKSSTGFIQTYHHPAYQPHQFQFEEEEPQFPKGCYVLVYNGRHTGYFNTAPSGGSDKDSKALCRKGRKIETILKFEIVNKSPYIGLIDNQLDICSISTTRT